MLEYMHYAKNVFGFQKMDPNYTCNLVGLFDVSYGIFCVILGV